MPEYLRSFLSVTGIFLLLFFFNTHSASSQSGLDTAVRAQVGEFSLSLRGFASQNASIELKSDNILLSKTMADSTGAFRFVKIPINSGFSSFCLEHTDAKDIGNSEACIELTPQGEDVSIDDIYLPPTIGLENPQITIGSSGLTYGYTMEEAIVALTFKNGLTFSTKSDKSGRYSYTLGNLSVGKYEIAAKGDYRGKKSLDPVSGITLEVLTSSTAFTNEAIGIRRALAGLLIWVVLMALLGIPVALYLIHRYRPEWLRFLFKSKLFIFLDKKRSGKLHHDWFVGY